MQLQKQGDAAEKNLRGLVEEVRKTGASRVLVQLPEGLKTKAISIMEALENSGISVLLSNDPVYGACDLADSEAAAMQCDLLLHVGHNRFYIDTKPGVKVLYYKWPFDADAGGIDFSAIAEKRVGVMTNMQHMQLVDGVMQKLRATGKEARFGGQLLGCWTGNAERIEQSVDAFLFVGSGDFHPLALRGKNVYVLDVERREIRKLDAAKHEKRRWGRILKAKDAVSFGILVSSKPGQAQLLAKADDIKKRIESAGKKAYIVVMDEISDARLEGLRVDAFINTACPRLEDDSFAKPFINAGDLEEVLKE